MAPNDQAAAYWFYMAASAGDRCAMNALGGLSAAGRGVAQDWSAALFWWERAETWRFVGDACGIVVEQDYERALSYYRKGAEAHDAASSIQAGHILAEGCAARIDDEAAHDAYKRAADEGYPEAQIGLSTLYLEGRGGLREPAAGVNGIDGRLRGDIRQSLCRSASTRQLVSSTVTRGLPRTTAHKVAYAGCAWRPPGAPPAPARRG